MELITRRRENTHQALNSIGILFGVLFTAASLVATALSVRTTQRELQNSQEGQITDRYTKAVDQLGSDKLDVRLGGIYALERLAADSRRDDRTVYDVLTAFVRERAAEPCTKIREYDPEPISKITKRSPADLQAALTVIGQRKHLNDGYSPDLAGVLLQNANLTHANLTHANLFCAGLPYSNLASADLSGGDMHGAHLEHANLTHTLLSGTRLFGAFMFNADLRNANLSNADLSDVDLTSADLTGANLTNANLSGARLMRVVGMTPAAIRKQAHVDPHTRF